MIYELLLTIGGLGLTAQVALGFVHGGHDHNGHGDGHAAAHGTGHGADHSGAHGGAHGGHAGHTDAHAGSLAHGHSAPAHGHAATHHTHAGSSQHHDGHDASGAGKVSVSVLLWLSPLNLFSVALGAGATGMALRPFRLEEWLTALCAALGGIALLVLLVRPLWSLILRFQSTPAETLAGAVTREGIASSRFDAQGRGVVRVTVDGETVRLLAVFDPDERAQAAAVAPGDRLLVTGIDATRNQCRVTKL